MAHQQLLERRKRIGGNVESRQVDVLEELEEVLRLVRGQDDLGEGFVADALAQDQAAIERNLLVLIAAECGGVV